MLLFLFISSWQYIIEFINNFSSFLNFVDTSSSSTYQGTNSSDYFEAREENISNLMSSYLNLRSAGSAFICTIVGIVLLVEPARENVIEFIKRLFNYFFH